MKKIIYANDLAPRDGILRVHCVAHESEYMKADAYIIEFNGQVWLLDGGMPNSTAARDYLCAIRERWLGGARQDGRPRMKLDWIISHFHIDHVTAPLNSIFPDPAFEFGRIYLPPDSALAPEYGETGIDGDAKYRPLMKAALEKYGSGRERVIDIGFGSGNVLGFSDASGHLGLTIYPPITDRGVGRELEYMIRNYCDGDRNDRSLPMAVINSSSVWLHLSYFRSTFLFTGDTMKRDTRLDDESGDEMIRAYKDQIGRVDVVKYPHHGYKRDAAAGIVMSLEPRYIIMSSRNETATAALARAFPDMTAKIYNCSFGDIVFSTDGNSIEVVADEKK